MRTINTFWQQVANALGPFYSFAWRLLLVLAISRVLLVTWQWDRVTDAQMLLPVFVQGARFDLVLLGLLLAVPVLLFPLLASNKLLLPAWRVFLLIYFTVVLLLVTFLELSAPSFIDQFDARPNILFVEYLNHPREVSATLFAAYKIPLMFTVGILAGLAFVTTRQLRTVLASTRASGVLPTLFLFPVLLICCAGMVRSTLDHRPVNPSTVAISNDPMVNDLALGSAYTLLYAVYETRHEPSGGFRYASLEEDDVFSEVRAAMHVAPSEFCSSSLPTLHRQFATTQGKSPKNLVIIIEESLGAEFVGLLGGLDLTPNLDKLASQGIWFENLYATGTRSVRGLEAIVSGYTPTPARSVVKLGKSQRGFFTLGQLLGNEGYETSFIYGGESQFDNMRRFFMNNGFARVIDKNDYQNPVFTGSWGVSDEDLFNKAHEEFSSKKNQPFFSVVFTSSNHSPFQYPDDRIELFDEEKQTVNNAVKYADYALGQFFEQARASDYWEDTVFLVIADHNSRVYGNELVPIERFHIPGLILGGSIKAQVFEPIASQIDMGPTLLSLIGVDSEHPMIGADLTTADARVDPGRAIMQFNGTQAYMQGNEVAILQKDLPVRQFDYVDSRLVEHDGNNRALVRRATAHAAWSSIAYERSLHRLPRHSELVTDAGALNFGSAAY